MEHVPNLHLPACYVAVPFDEARDGPYYTHLGVAPDMPSIRQLMENQ